MEPTWRKIDCFSVGGLREIGFYRDTNFLMVMSNGRGIFDCYEGKKVARDYFDYYMNKWNSETGIIEGFDFLEGENINCGGFEHPDILKKNTGDGWSVIIRYEKRLVNQNELAECEIMYLINEYSREEIELMTFFYEIDRGYGFSNNDNCFVIGTSSDLHIWKRINALNIRYS